MLNDIQKYVSVVSQQSGVDGTTTQLMNFQMNLLAENDIKTPQVKAVEEKNKIDSVFVVGG